MLTRKPIRVLCGWALRMAGRDRGGARVTVPEPSAPYFGNHDILKQKWEGFGSDPRGTASGSETTGRLWDLSILGRHVAWWS